MLSINDLIILKWSKSWYIIYQIIGNKYQNEKKIGIKNDYGKFFIILKDNKTKKKNKISGTFLREISRLD